MSAEIQFARMSGSSGMGIKPSDVTHSEAAPKESRRCFPKISSFGTKRDVRLAQPIMVAANSARCW
jgi:hypothetical protein